MADKNLDLLIVLPLPRVQSIAPWHSIADDIVCRRGVDPAFKSLSSYRIDRKITVKKRKRPQSPLPGASIIVAPQMVRGSAAVAGASNYLRLHPRQKNQE